MCISQNFVYNCNWVGGREREWEIVASGTTTLTHTVIIPTLYSLFKTSKAVWQYMKNRKSTIWAVSLSNLYWTICTPMIRKSIKINICQLWSHSFTSCNIIAKCIPGKGISVQDYLSSLSPLLTTERVRLRACSRKAANDPHSNTQFSCTQMMHMYLLTMKEREFSPP